MDKRRRTRYRRMLEEKQQELENLLARVGEAGRGADLASPDPLIGKSLPNPEDFGLGYYFSQPWMGKALSDKWVRCKMPPRRCKSANASG